MEIITLSPRGFGANTYIITNGDNRAIVVDPAQTRVEGELIKRGLQATHVLLTHCHFDHVGGVSALQEGGAKVYTSKEEKPLVGTEMDLASHFGAPTVRYGVDETFEDGEEKILNGISVTAILTPGHTKGSVCYLFKDAEGEYLFTGDTLFMDSIGRVDFPTGSMAQMRGSLKKLCDLQGDYPVFAGHNEETTLDRERRENPFLVDL